MVFHYISAGAWLSSTSPQLLASYLPSLVLHLTHTRQLYTFSVKFLCQIQPPHSTPSLSFANTRWHCCSASLHGRWTDCQFSSLQADPCSQHRSFWAGLMAACFCIRPFTLSCPRSLSWQLLAALCWHLLLGQMCIQNYVLKWQEDPKMDAQSLLPDPKSVVKTQVEFLRVGKGNMGKSTESKTEQNRIECYEVCGTQNTQRWLKSWTLLRIAPYSLNSASPFSVLFEFSMAYLTHYIVHYRITTTHCKL